MLDMGHGLAFKTNNLRKLFFIEMCIVRFVPCAAAHFFCPVHCSSYKLLVISFRISAIIYATRGKKEMREPEYLGEILSKF